MDDLNQYNRHSIRYKGYDYTLPGAYFVTIVTQGHKCSFGEVVNGKMTLNRYGEIVANTWEWLAQRYPYVEVIPYTVMPNHFHGILQIHEIDGFCRGGSRAAPTKGNQIKPLGQLIGVFKTVSTKQINLVRESPGKPVWQRNYYEHIIRNTAEMEKIAEYLIANPNQWSSDPEIIQIWTNQ